MRAVGRVLLAVVAVSTSTVAAYPTSVIASSPTPPIITFSGGPYEFSPNGDRQDDTIVVVAYVDQLVDIVMNIATQAGTNVRDLPRYSRVVRCGVFDDNRSFCTESYWDGLDDAGVLAPDGDYLLIASATDGDGNTTTATAPITINMATAGTLTAPTPDSFLTGQSTVTFVADPRFGAGAITDVRVQFFPFLGEQPCSSFYASLVATNSGVWQSMVDTTSCRQGTGYLSIGISYVDTRGTEHGYNFDSFFVSVSNPVPALVGLVGGNRAFSPDGDGHDDTVGVSVYVDEPASLTLNVTTSTGTVVRGLLNAPTLADCSADIRRIYRYCEKGSWDGRDDAGVLAPDGNYLLVAVAVDGDGNTTTESTEVTVNTASAGTLTSPSPGSILSGTATFVFTPDPRFIGGTITGVDVAFAKAPNPSRQPCGLRTVALALAETGQWQATVDTISCREGSGTLNAYARYTDELGTKRRRLVSSIEVSFFNPAPARINFYGDLSPFTPNGDGLDDKIRIIVVVDEPATVTTRITTQAGTTVRSSLAEPNFDYCAEPVGIAVTGRGTCASVTWDGLDDAGALAPDGVYLLVASAVDSDSNVTIATKPITLNTGATPPIEIPETPTAILLSICAGGWLALAGRRRRAAHPC